MQTLGLHIEGKRLYSVLLKTRRGKPQVIHFQSIPYSKAPVFVKQIYTKNKDVVIATGLSTPEVVTREIRFNLRSKATLLTALPFRIESNVPFPPEETAAYTLFRKGKGKETFVTLFACREAHLDAHIEQWKALTADPYWLSCSPQALHRYASHFFPKVPSLLLFHMGSRHCTYLVIQNDRLVLSQHLPIGSSLFFHALKQDDASLSDEFLDDIDISETRTPHLYRLSQKFKQEIARVKTFLERKGFTSLPSLVCGEIPGPIESILEMQFKSPLKSSSKEFSALQPFAIPFGLALDALHQDRRSVQFRQDKKSSKKWRLHFKKLLTTYFSLSLVFSLLFGSIKSFGITAKKRNLERKLSTILEKEVSLEEGITTLEHAAVKTRSTMTLPTAPKVSDVLQWVGTHPLLKKGPNGTPLEIKRLQYKLERYPKLGEKKEPYLARVELEISSTTPTIARDFHNALLKGDTLVDEKKEIVWKTSHNAYFAKFYLKNKRQ